MLSVFADWSRGTYGSGSDTDIFIVCPRVAGGTAVLEGNGTRLMNILAKPGRSQDVMVFKAILDYTRKGIPIYLEAFTPPRVIIQPLGKRAIYVFDKDLMYEQHFSLRDVRDHDGQQICTVSTTNRGVILPSNALTSRPPDRISFDQKFSVSGIVQLRLRGISFIPVN